MHYKRPVASGKEETLRMDLERVDHWVSKGAQPSDRVVSLIKDAKNPEAKKARDEKKSKKCHTLLTYFTKFDFIS